MKESIIIDVIGESDETPSDEIEMSFVLDRENDNVVEIRLDDILIAKADLKNILESMNVLLNVFGRRPEL